MQLQFKFTLVLSFFFLCLTRNIFWIVQKIFLFDAYTITAHNKHSVYFTAFPWNKQILVYWVYNKQGKLSTSANAKTSFDAMSTKKKKKKHQPTTPTQQKKQRYDEKRQAITESQ